MKTFLKKYKIPKYVSAVLFGVLSIVVVVLAFSFDSLLGWFLTKDKAELDEFIFWVIFSVVFIVVSFIMAIILTKKEAKKS